MFETRPAIHALMDHHRLKTFLASMTESVLRSRRNEERAMSMAVNAAFERLVLKLNTIVRLTEAEKQSIMSLPLIIRDLRPDQDIVREGDRPTQCCLIVEGLAYRYKIVGD